MTRGMVKQAQAVRKLGTLQRTRFVIKPGGLKPTLQDCPHAWRWSSFHRLVREGVYDADWCCGCDYTPVPLPEFKDMDPDGIETAFGE